jgi:hypothetical protein
MSVAGVATIASENGFTEALASLSELSLKETQITDAGLKRLIGLTNLKTRILTRLKSVAWGLVKPALATLGWSTSRD